VKIPGTILIRSTITVSAPSVIFKNFFPGKIPSGSGDLIKTPMRRIRDVHQNLHDEK
jgi:hypothetical protein